MVRRIDDSAQANNPNLQRKFPPMDDHDESPTVNPYYRYIRNNIRSGIA
jgi:hypothetical protein